MNKYLYILLMVIMFLSALTIAVMALWSIPANWITYLAAILLVGSISPLIVEDFTYKGKESWKQF